MMKRSENKFGASTRFESKPSMTEATLLSLVIFVGFILNGTISRPIFSYRSNSSQLVTLHFGSRSIPVLCHFGDFGCGDGGWTVVMKIDGNKVLCVSPFFYRTKSAESD